MSLRRSWWKQAPSAHSSNLNKSLYIDSHCFPNFFPMYFLPGIITQVNYQQSSPSPDYAFQGTLIKTLEILIPNNNGKYDFQSYPNLGGWSRSQWALVRRPGSCYFLFFEKESFTLTYSGIICHFCRDLGYNK